MFSDLSYYLKFLANTQNDLEEKLREIEFPFGKKKSENLVNFKLQVTKSPNTLV
jgi:thermostable 8-oxoguanine DNA glycosylase